MRYFMFGLSNGSIMSLQRGTFLPEQTWKNRTFIPKAISFPSYFLYSLGSVFRQFYLNKSLFGPKPVSLAVVKSPTFVHDPDPLPWMWLQSHKGIFYYKWVQIFIWKIKANSYKIYLKTHSLSVFWSIQRNCTVSQMEFSCLQENVNYDDDDNNDFL